MACRGEFRRGCAAHAVHGDIQRQRRLGCRRRCHHDAPGERRRGGRPASVGDAHRLHLGRLVHCGVRRLGDRNDHASHCRCRVFRSLDGEHVHRHVRCERRRQRDAAVENRHLRRDLRRTADARARRLLVVRRLVHGIVRRRSGDCCDARDDHRRPDSLCALDQHHASAHAVHGHVQRQRRLDRRRCHDYAPGQRRRGDRFAPDGDAHWLYAKRLVDGGYGRHGGLYRHVRHGRYGSLCALDA